MYAFFLFLGLFLSFANASLKGRDFDAMLTPINDRCSQAIQVNCGTKVPGSTTGAGIDAPTTAVCGTLSGLAGDVWFRVSGTGGLMGASTCSFANFDTRLHILEGSCGNLVCIAGNDNGCSGNRSEVSWSSVAGRTYYILVHGGPGSTGDFELTVRSGALNQECWNSGHLGPGTLFGNTSCAAPDSVPVCSGTSQTSSGGLWYQVNGTGNKLRASTCGATNFDTQIRVYSGNCGSLQCIAGNDNFCGLQSQLEWCTQVGQDYFVLINGVGGAEGAFNLILTDLPSAPQLQCPHPAPYQTDSGTCGKVVHYPPPTVMDDCPGSSVQLDSGRGIGAFFPIGTYTEYYRVFDAGGNQDSCTVSISVFDGEHPVAVCVQDTLFLDSLGNAQVNPSRLDGGSSDNCSIDSMFTVPSQFSMPVPGWYQAILRVRDHAGLWDSCFANLFIQDTIAPVIQCRARVFPLPASGQLRLNAHDFDAGSFDNLQLDSIWLDRYDFTCRDLGTHSLVLSGADISGNVSTCTTQVIIHDSSGLTIRVPDLGADTTVCPNDTFNLSTSSQFHSYMWSTGSQNPGIQVTQPGFYFVAVMDSFGCMGHDSIQLSHYPLPSTLLNSVGPPIICMQDTLDLYGAWGFKKYLWSNGDSSRFTKVIVPGRQSLYVEDSIGCNGRDTMDIVYLPYPDPVPNVSPSGTLDLCPGSPMVLDAGAGFFGYVWNTGASNQTLAIAQPGDYWVTVYNGFGCAEVSDTIHVLAGIPPAIPSIQLIADSLVSSPADAYQWNLNGSPISGATNLKLKPVIPGFYSVTVFDSAGCSSTSVPWSFLVNASEAIYPEIKLVPNPAGSSVQIQIRFPAASEVRWELLSLQGKLLRSGGQTSPVSSYSEAVSLVDLPAGVYLVRIFHSGTPVSLLLEHL